MVDMVRMEDFFHSFVNEENKNSMMEEVSWEELK